ncbi:MAG: 3-deoxy-D-manno-octulosonic acid transferase, partial [Verrucomicrobia bacterium]|nr:3-deoxy-D-manno-octulosonic acid transferase [Verrucomicrobiota bacterium]
MRCIYNLLFTVAFWVSVPYYFWRMWRRGNWREGFEQRFGQFSAKTKQALTNRHVVWIHAVSVGEVNLCTQLIHALEPRLPNVKLVVSTTTATGMAELQKKLPSHIERIYFPIDRRRYVARALNVVHPEAVILVEAEIWPNFLWRIQDKGIPCFLVNARLSERSFRGYRRWSSLFRPLFAAFTAVGAQNEADAGRLRELGCLPERICVVGSLKFDAAVLSERRVLDVPGLLNQLGVPEGAILLVAGSTHAGEEVMLASMFLRLRRRFPSLFLILVPRHHERSKEVAAEVGGLGLKLVYRTNLQPSTRHAPGEVDCLLVNTTGELRQFYAQATVVYVGKSLGATGGQNPIEPGALGKAMVFGPHMENFESIAAEFVKREAAMQVRGEAELETALELLISDPGRRQRMGERAAEVVQENRGALERTLEMILEPLEQTELAPLLATKRVSASA